MPSALLLTPLLVASAVVHAVGASGSPGYSDDEGTYVAQAFAVREWHTLAHYTYWYDHPPLGWLQLAGWQSVAEFLSHSTAIGAARAFMVALSVLDVALIFLVARRLSMARPWALLAAALWAFSPLALSLSRQVFLDGIGLPWVLAAVALAASPSRSLWSHTAAGFCLAMGVLSKETLLLLAPGVVWLVLRHSDRYTRSFSVAGFCSGMLVLLGYPLLAALKNELLPGAGHVSLVDAVRFQLWARPSNGSALHPGTAAHDLFLGWWHADPWLLGLSLTALPALLIRRLRPVAATLVMLIVVAARPGYLPEPYVVALLPLTALCAAGVLDALSRASWLPRAGAVVATLALVVQLAPGWARADRALMRQSHVQPLLAAEDWLVQHADRRQRVVVDDTMWVDLVARGFPRDRVVWLYKLDFVNNLDPSVARVIRRPADLGYLVVTDIARATLASSSRSPYAIVHGALEQSRTVASFGSGRERVEIRKVQR